LSKGNYNIARMGYLAKLMPEARFIIPVRDPVSHVASLDKQHRLFLELERADPRVLAYMRRVGHFEFGLDRRPLNLGNGDSTREILAAWQRGEDVEGLALCWAEVYGYVLRLLAADAGLARRCLIVRYGELCSDGERMLNEIADFLGLEVARPDLARIASRLHAPTYYRIDYTLDERATIDRLTKEVAAQLAV
jgi:hypothetical protein